MSETTPDAEILFPTATPTPSVGAPKPAPTLAAPERMTEPVDRDLYGDDVPKPTEMFSPEVALRGTFQSRNEDVADVLGLSGEQRQARHRAFVSVVRETGVDAETLGGLIYQTYTDAQLAEARGVEADLERQVKKNWDVETRTTLRSMYGAPLAEELLARTDRFVQAHPKLQTMLQTRRIGADPTLRLALVEHVRRNHIR